MNNQSLSLKLRSALPNSILIPVTYSFCGKLNSSTSIPVSVPLVKVLSGQAVHAPFKLVLYITVYVAEGLGP